MKKKKKGSFFSGLLVFVLLIVLACTAMVNLVFSSDRVPRIAGYYLYMQDSDDMEPTVPKESLVAAEAAVISELHEGNTVLCYLADGTLAIRKICKIEEAEDGITNYYPGTAKEQGVDAAIPRTNIFAVCVWASPELYWYINFATTVKGLMFLLVLPCVILIIMLLAHLARGSSDSMEDEEFTFEEEEETAPKKKKKHTSKPVPEISEEKKAPAPVKSVDENPPQKPLQEHEKTTKFRKQEIQEEALKVFDDPYPKQKKASTQIFSSEQIREEARIQAQQKSMPTPSYSAPVQQSAPEPMPVPVPEVSQQMPAPEPAPTPAPVQEVKPEPPKPVPAPKKPVYSSPNIDDILNANKKSRSAISSSDSIDDLIRLIEDEKKKL